MTYNKQSRLALWAVGALAASVGSAAAQSYGTSTTTTATVSGQSVAVVAVRASTVTTAITPGPVTTATGATQQVAVLAPDSAGSTTATLPTSLNTTTAATIVVGGGTTAVTIPAAGTNLAAATDGGAVTVSMGTASAPVVITGGTTTVGNNATLSGVFTARAPVVIAAGGTLNVGNSPGMATFTSAATIASTGKLVTDIDGASPGNGAGFYDQITMDGTAAVFTANGTLTPQTLGITGSANNSYKPTIGSKFVIVNAINGGSVTGTFTTITPAAANSFKEAGSMFSAIYNPTSIALYVTPTNLASVPGQTLTTNQTAVAGALQGLRTGYESGNTDQRSFLDGLYSQSSANLPVAYDQVSGRDIANIGAASLSTANLVSDTLTVRANNPRVSAQTGLNTGLAGGDGNGRGWAVWAAPVGQIGSSDGDSEAPGYSRGSAGVLTGLEGQFNNAVLGLSFGYVRDWIDFKSNSNTANVDNYIISGYGAYTAGPVFLNGSLGYTWKAVETKRNIALGSYSGTTTGKTDGGNFNIGGEVGYTFALNDGIVVEPAFGLRYNSFTLDGFTESGAAPVNLVFGGHTVDSLQSSLGFRVAKTIRMDSGTVVVPEARAAWQHELLNDRSSITTRFVNGGGNFTIVGTKGDTDFGVIGLGIKAQLPSKFDLSAGYTTRFSANQMDHGFMAGVKYRF